VLCGNTKLPRVYCEEGDRFYKQLSLCRVEPSCSVSTDKIYVLFIHKIGLAKRDEIRGMAVNMDPRLKSKTVYLQYRVKKVALEPIFKYIPYSSSVRPSTSSSTLTTAGRSRSYSVYCYLNFVSPH
jgi:hypothetical protein